jgi:hypothetical protein
MNFNDEMIVIITATTVVPGQAGDARNISCFNSLDS